MSRLMFFHLAGLKIACKPVRQIDLGFKYDYMFTRLPSRSCLLILLCCCAVLGFLPACRSGQALSRQPDCLMDHLLLFEGRQLPGTIIFPAGAEAPFQGQQISLQVLASGQKQVRLPILRDQQVYRTLILRSEEAGYSLQHEHKKPNGQQAEISMYGGRHEGARSPYVLIFPADAYSRQLLGELRENVWSLALNNDRSVLSYIMEENGHVTMQIDFDLSQGRPHKKARQETFLDMPKKVPGKHPALALGQQ